MKCPIYSFVTYEMSFHEMSKLENVSQIFISFVKISYCLYYTLQKCRGTEFLLYTQDLGIPTIMYPRFLHRLIKTKF